MPIDLQSVPYFSQYFGLWMMAEENFWAEFQAIKSLNLSLHLSGHGPQAARESANEQRPPQEGVAILNLDGKLMKQAGSTGGTSTVSVRNQLRQFGRDARISGILLNIDSPGGTVAGTEELANEVARVGRMKPIHAFVDDLGASAAYWIASQAAHVSTNSSGIVGSIGTYGAVYDSSGAAAMEGVKAYVVRAGKFKGMATPGTEVTQEHLAEMQRTVDALNARFLEGVASGRRMNADRVAELADGRAHVGKEALALGLVDSIGTFDAAFERLQAAISTRRSSSVMQAHLTPEATIGASAPEPIVAQLVSTVAAPTQPKPATLQEIKAACENADAAFLMAQLEASSTIEQATRNWMATLNSRLAASTAETAQAKAAALKPGVAPIAGSGKVSPTASEASRGKGPSTTQFFGLVKEHVDAGKTRPQAIERVVAENADVHAAMLAENVHVIERPGRR